MHKDYHALALLTSLPYGFNYFSYTNQSLAKRKDGNQAMQAFPPLKEQHDLKHHRILNTTQLLQKSTLRQQLSARVLDASITTT